MRFLRTKEIDGHAGAIYTCVCDQVETYFYSGSADKYVVRWKIKEGIQDNFVIQFDHSIYALELINDELLAVGLSNGDFHFFNPIERKELKFYQQHTKGIFSIRNNIHKGQLFVGDADGNLSVWDVESLDLIIYLPLDAGKIRSISVDDTGDHVALACQDGSIRIFETNYFNEIQTIQAHKGGATSVLFMPNNNSELISGGKDALLKRWNWKDGVECQSIIAHTFSIYDLMAINNGETIITASRDKNIKVWNASDLALIERLDFNHGGHRHSVNAISKINESTFISCSDDKRILVWKAT